MSPEQLLDKVEDRFTFIDFVQALAEERDRAIEIERQDPQRYQVDGAFDWKNAEISSYLYACLVYFEEGKFHKPDTYPTWKMFAEFLYFGKIIE